MMLECCQILHTAIGKLRNIVIDIDTKLKFYFIIHICKLLFKLKNTPAINDAMQT